MDRDSQEIMSFLPEHRKQITHEPATKDELRERCNHSKIVLHLQARVEERDAWAVRRRIMEMHSTTGAGASWPRLLKVKADVHPQKTPEVAELGNLWTWFRKTGMANSLRVWTSCFKNKEHHPTQSSQHFLPAHRRLGGDGLRTQAVFVDMACG